MQAVVGEAAESGNDSEWDFDHALNVVLTAFDIALPTVNYVPPLTLKVISLEQCRDERVTIDRE